MKRSPLRIVVSGCCGRMGSLIIQESLKDPEHFQLVAGIEYEKHPQLRQPLPDCPQIKVASNLLEHLKGADLLIEFTTPEASVAHAQIAASAKVPLLIGTTGFSTEQFKQLQELSREIAIFWSPNMSIGIVIVRKTIHRVHELLQHFGLDRTAQIRISETHHVSKKDKPSGTAKQLAEEVRRVTGQTIAESDIKARREGDVVGIHAVTFQLASEGITLQHEAMERRVFAQGALLVARNFHQVFERPGWYTMDDFVK